MANITCDAVKCIYNCDRGCCLERINVDGDEALNYNETECASFNEKKSALTNSNCTCGSEIPCYSSEIKCSAEKCIYNSKHTCIADEICIGTCYASECDETRCETFTC